MNTTNFLLIYAREKSAWNPNRVFTARERDDRYNQFIENIETPYPQWKITTLMKAFAAGKGITERDARVQVKAKPNDLDQFVIRNARSVIRLARPSYEGVSADARKLIDESKHK